MNELFFRAVSVKPENIDEENRTITVSFSSEHPVNRRYYGQEVLLHGENSVDFEYLNTVGSVLRKHGGDMADIVGSVEKAWIDGRRGMAVIRFDDDENGNTAMRKIKSGSLRGISAGYMIEKGIRLDDESDVWVDPETTREYKGPAIIATRWRPHEITLTPIPADHTVGFGRSLVENIDLQTIKNEDKEMNENEIRELIKTTVADAVANIPKSMTAEELAASVRSIIKDESTPKIQVDRDTLSDLSSRASAVSDVCKSKVFDMALEGRSHVEMLTFINDEAVKDPDARHKRSAGDDHHDKKGDQQYRKIEEIPDELFSGAFRA